MQYDSNTVETITLNFSIDTRFNRILTDLDKLEFPEIKSESQSIKHGVLELIINSLRAHREHEIDQKIEVTFNDGGGRITISVKDHGKGFNINELPYSFL